jgi:hypothetical protein
MALELVIVIAVIGACAYFVGRPLWDARPRVRDLDEGRRAELRRQKEGLLSSLREMEFDFRTGKLTEEDYGAMRSDLEARAIETLRQLDALEASAGLDARLEDEIRALKTSIAARQPGKARGL